MSRTRYHHIPPCGGLHSSTMESYCTDCQTLKHYKTMEIIAEAYTESQDLEAPRPRPRTVYIPAATQTSTQTKGGFSIEPKRK